MSGVIDDDGQQWERCNYCVEFKRIERLGYDTARTPEAPYGRMVCIACLPRVADITTVNPAADWVPVYEDAPT